MKKIQEEVNRIQTDLKDQQNGSPWVSNPRPKDGTFWEDDVVTSTLRLGDNTAAALRNLGITTVKAMATNMEFLKNSSIRGMNTHLQKITNTKCSSCPHLRIDYTKSDNPYCERYGDNWENKVKKHLHFHHLCALPI